MTLVIGSLAVLLTLLVAILAIAAGLFALSVAISFALAWYERVNADPEVAERRRHAFTTRLLLGEFTCLLLTLLLRPLGWFPPLPLHRRSRRTPVILLHGLFQNRSSMFLLHWRLSFSGFDQVVSINTPPWLPFDVLTSRVAEAVDQARQQTGSTRVHLIGHSMGGILARSYVQLEGGASGIASCITIGTPHAGTKLAPFAVSKLGRSLLPGSDLLQRLNAAPLPGQVAFTAIYSRHDNIIVPMENARMSGASNIEMSGMGHTTMLFSRQVAMAVVAALESGREEP
jgi:triacylglycerol esterase/lipase EstA (alpha/beta hydrolase family)